MSPTFAVIDWAQPCNPSAGRLPVRACGGAVGVPVTCGGGAPPGSGAAVSPGPSVGSGETTAPDLLSPLNDGTRNQPATSVTATATSVARPVRASRGPGSPAQRRPARAPRQAQSPSRPSTRVTSPGPLCTTGALSRSISTGSADSAGLSGSTVSSADCGQVAAPGGGAALRNRGVPPPESRCRPVDVTSLSPPAKDPPSPPVPVGSSAAPDGPVPVGSGSVVPVTQASIPHLGQLRPVARYGYSPGMPRYEYRCRACGGTFELNRPMSESGAPAHCPAGHTDTVKLLSTVAVARQGAAAAAPAAGGGCCGGSCGC